MKRKEIILGVVLSVFILISAPVLANIANTEMQPSFKTVLIENQNNVENLLINGIVDSSKDKERLYLLENSEVDFELDRGKLTLPLMKLFLNNSKIPIFMKSHYPIFSEDYLNYTYTLGLQISKNLDASELKSIINLNNFKDFGKIYEILDNIKGNSDCGCNNEKSSLWNFPVACTLIFPLYVFIIILWGLTGIHDLFILWTEIEAIGIKLGCWWT